MMNFIVLFNLPVGRKINLMVARWSHINNKETLHI